MTESRSVVRGWEWGGVEGGIAKGQVEALGSSKYIILTAAMVSWVYTDTKLDQTVPFKCAIFIAR